MPKPKHLHPDPLLGIRLSATMSRNRYTADPGPVIEQLLQIAGDRLDILADEAGRWIGFYEDDHTRTLATALRALPLDMDDTIALGQFRRHEPPPSTERTRAPGMG